MTIYDQNGEPLFYVSCSHYNDDSFFDLDFAQELSPEHTYKKEMYDFWCQYSERHQNCYAATVVFVWDKPYWLDNQHQVLHMGVAPLWYIWDNIKKSGGVINHNIFNKKLFLHAALGRALKRLGYKLVKRVHHFVDQYSSLEYKPLIKTTQYYALPRVKRHFIVQ